MKHQRCSAASLSAAACREPCTTPAALHAPTTPRCRARRLSRCPASPACRTLWRGTVRRSGGRGRYGHGHGAQAEDAREVPSGHTVQPKLLRVLESVQLAREVGGLAEERGHVRVRVELRDDARAVVILAPGAAESERRHAPQPRRDAVRERGRSAGNGAGDRRAWHHAAL
jgi:hypothetical protein